MSCKGTGVLIMQFDDLYGYGPVQSFSSFLEERGGSSKRAPDLVIA